MQVAIESLSAGKLDAILVTELTDDILGVIRSYDRSAFLRQDVQGQWSVLWRHYGMQSLNTALTRINVGESILLPSCTTLNCSEYQIARVISKRCNLNLTGRVTPEGVVIQRLREGERGRPVSNKARLRNLPIGESLTEAEGYTGPLIQALRMLVVSEPLLFDVQHSRAGRAAGQLEYKITKLDILDLYDKPLRQVKGRGVLRHPLANLRRGRTFLTRRTDRLTLDFLSGDLVLDAGGNQYRFKHLGLNEQGDTLLEVV